jgi:protein O-GlcNAc transferase
MDSASELHRLGIIEIQSGRLDAAIDLIRRAIEIDPVQPTYWLNLGESYFRRGNLEKAIECFREAIRIDPGYSKAHNSLGNALRSAGLLKESAAACWEAIRLSPDFAEAFSNLGNALGELDQLDAAIAAFRQAIRLNPQLAEAHFNLANALKDAGELDQSIASYRSAIALRPNLPEAINSLAYIANFHPDFDPKMILEECRRCSEAFERSLPAVAPYSNDRSPTRRLRIGYVSPDFRTHPIGRFILPLLRSHNHRDFEIFCYSSAKQPDNLTSILHQHADIWRDVLTISDERLAEIVRNDQIDILVDLTMHMAGSRLPLFARKPAPVQVTYLAYAGTTGLQAIDYRITDPYLDPPGSSDEFYSERSIRLARSYWCYEPPIEATATPPHPAAADGFITFGCLNNFAKVTPLVMDLWTELMIAVPNSRLLLHANPGSHRDRARQTFRRRNIADERLVFIGYQSLPDYMLTYNRLDIALDPIPYVGGTTTCDALWMGVPLITMPGQTAISRGGVSILNNIGLPELIAQTPAEYIEIARTLANDKNRLATLHATIRDRMTASPLMDAKRFASDMENAYRTIWLAWCQKSPE